MTAWTLTDIPDQSGRVAVVTGANSGIGLETTRALADSGALVVMACRDRARGEAARSRLLERLSDRAGAADRLVVVELDLADPASIAVFADRFANDYEQLDLLINNAGVMAVPPELTAAGIERQWAINHLGHFALTGLLLPTLNLNGARVVSVSSLAAAGGNPDNPIRTDLDGYARFPVYSDTKLANQVFAVELNHRLAASGSTALSVVAHPGVSHTNLGAGTAIPVATRLLLMASRLATQPASEGALPILRAATDETVEGGQYYGPSGRRQHRGAPRQIPLVAGAAARSLGRRLWAQSMELSGVRYLTGD